MKSAPENAALVLARGFGVDNCDKVTERATCQRGDPADSHSERRPVLGWTDPKGAITILQPGM